MIKTFNIKSGSIQYGDVDESWFFKKIWAFITRKKYTRKFWYRVVATTDGNRNIRVGDVFITGLAKPHLSFRVIAREGFYNITAISVNSGDTKKPVIIGACCIIGHVKNK